MNKEITIRSKGAKEADKQSSASFISLIQPMTVII